MKFSNNWILKEFRLSEDFQIYNIDFKKDTWVFYTDEFQLTSVLPQETKIQGYRCIGGGGKKGIHTSFYSNSRLKTFFAPGNIEINSIWCKGGKLNYISIHKDGTLKKCKLVKDHEIEGVIFKKNTILELDKTGNTKK